MMRRLRQNLVVQFSAISFVVGAVVAVACILVISSRIRAAAIDDLVQRTESDVSTYFLKEMTPADLEEPMTEERYDRLHELVQHSILGGRIARVKVWAMDGTVIYSDNQEMVGKKFQDDEDVIKALQGETVAEIAEPGDPENEYERSLGTLISVYVPIVFPGYWEPQGVFEVYQLYEPTAQLIQQMQRWLVLVGAVGFIFLYGGSVAIVGRGWRTIQRQEADLDRSYEALRESEELHRAVVENMAEAVAITRDAKRVFVNKAFLDIHGLQDVSQVIGKPMGGIIFPEDREMVVARSLARQRGEPVTSFYEYRVVRQDREVRTVETLAVPLRYRGEPATLAVLRDVTDERRAEEALRVQSAVAMNMSEGAFVVGYDDGLIRWANPKFEEMFGYELGELIGKHVSVVNAPTDISPEERAAEIIGEIRREGAWHGEVRNIKKDGTPFWSHASVSVISHPQHGRVLVAVHLDITERKRVEEALRESEELHRAVVENMAEAVAISRDAKRVFVNKAFLDIHGLRDVSQVVEKPMENFIFPEDRESVVGRSLARQRGEPVPSFNEYHVVRPNGEVRTVRAQAVLIQYKGQPAGLAVLRDVTDERRAEEALRESEELYRAMVENLAEGVAINRDAKRAYVNKAFLDIHGLQDDSQVIGEPMDKFVIPEDRGGMVARSLARQRGEPLPISNERRILRLDGELRIVRTLAVPIRYKGQPATLAVLRDVTEERQIEKERIQHAKELEEALRTLQETQQQLVQSEKLAAIGQLVAGVAHELNNPLTGVWGTAELVMRRDLDETMREDMEVIHSEAARAVKIVQNLLSFARSHRPEKSYRSMNDALEGVLELRAYEMRVSGIELERELQADLPESWFDFHQMQQVFLNIAVNAEQAMTEAHGGGKLTVRTRKVDGSIQISFTDDGPGIPKENLGRIFDPFFTTKEVGKGTGLGLSICYGIVQEHGGRLLVESEVGKGATFTVEIPMTTEKVT